MTDRSSRLSYENSGYISGKMVNDLSPKKTTIVLVIVIGCFAVLWPKVFYPMLLGSANNHIKPSPIDRTRGIKQERPLHLRSEMVHPAFRERGRAIPQSESFPAFKPAPPSRLIPKIVEGRPGPIPGMRPTIGGAGHVVPPSKHGGNSMGLIMPIYTIGIVVFFTYTVMKIAFKKQQEILYPPVDPDAHFRRQVFEADRGHLGSSRVLKDGSSGWKERDARDTELDQLRRRLRETESAMERIVEQMANVPLKFQDVLANGTVLNQEEDQGSVHVMGMETTASCEGGQKWVSPASPVHTPAPPEPVTPPQEIYLEGSLPPQSHLLVTDSATEAQKTEYENDPAVVLAGKMTLSVISLDSTENGTDDSSSSPKKHEDRSSSNVSEEFEKIDVAQLEEQINSLEIQPTLLERNILDDTTQEPINIEYPENTELSQIQPTPFEQRELNIEYPENTEELSQIQPTSFEQRELNIEYPENTEELSQIHPTSFEQRKLNIEYPVAKEELLVLQSATFEEENLDHKPEVILTTRDKRETSLEPILDEASILESSDINEEAEHNNEDDILESIKTESIDSTVLEPKNRENIEQEEISIEPTVTDVISDEVIGESRSVETEPSLQSPALQEDNLDEIKEYVKIQDDTSSHEDIQPLEAMSTTNVSNESSKDKNEDEENAEEVVPEVIEYLSDGDEEVDEEIEEEVEEEEEDEEVEDEESEEEDDEIDDEQIAHV